MESAKVYRMVTEAVDLMTAEMVFTNHQAMYS